MRFIRTETGSAMLASLVVLLLATLLGMASVDRSTDDMSIADNFRLDLKSFYTAEAGVELAYAILRDTVDWRTGFTEHPYDGGVFNVTLIDSSMEPALDETVLVRSEGIRSDAVSRVEVKFAPLRPYGWAAFADDYMKLCGGTSTDSYDSQLGTYAATRMDTLGDVGSNGHVKMCGTSVINGDASTSSPGDMEIDGGAQFMDTTSQAPVMYIDPIPQSDLDYARANSNAPAGMTGTFNYNNGTRSLRITPGNTVTLASGVYYFNDFNIQGDLELEPGAEVSIYLVGDATINAGAKINSLGSPGDFLMFSVGDRFDISAGAELRTALYAPDVQINLNGSADLYGSYIGDFADDLGGSSFHYDRSLRDLKMSSHLVKVAWREL